MKKFLTALLALCICVSALFALSSCDDSKDEAKKKERDTEKVELSGISDDELIRIVKDGMSEAQTKEFLTEAPANFGWGKIYKFTDGRVAYSRDGDIEIDRTVDRAKVAKLAVGMSYSEATEILGANGTEIGSGLLIYGYMLTDGQTLRIYFDRESADKSTWKIASFKAPTGNEEKPYTTDNLEAFKQHIIEVCRGQETTVPVPKLVSSEYTLVEAQDAEKYFSYVFVPKEHASKGTTYVPAQLEVLIYKTDGSYKELVEQFRATEKDGYAFTEDSKVLAIFMFNNNGKCIYVSTPSEYIVENKPINTVEKLNEYVVIEYLDIPKASN